MGPERRYQVKVIEQLRKRGAWVVKYPAGPHGAVGTPDLLCCYRGHFIAIECKAGNPRLKAHEPTVAQLKQLDAIRDAGGIALVAWPGGPDLDAMLDSLDQLDELVGTSPGR